MQKINPRINEVIFTHEMGGGEHYIKKMERP